MIHILLGPFRGGGGVSLPFDLARRARKGFAYLPTVWLASWRIRLNCFFILYFLRYHLQGEIFRIISLNVTVRAPQRRNAKSSRPYFPSFMLQAANAENASRDYIFSNDIFFFASTFAPLPAQGCWTNAPRALSGRERQQWQVAAAQQCSVGNGVKQACWWIKNPHLPVPIGHGAWSDGHLLF